MVGNGAQFVGETAAIGSAAVGGAYRAVELIATQPLPHASHVQYHKLVQVARQSIPATVPYLLKVRNEDRSCLGWGVTRFSNRLERRNYASNAGFVVQKSRPYEPGGADFESRVEIDEISDFNPEQAGLLL